MNSIPKLAFSSARRSAVSARSGASIMSLTLGILAALATAGTIQAQTINANATIAGVSAGGGLFNYTITLNNTVSSTSPIETFWYSWVPGQNYMPSAPTSVTPPTGWTDSVTHGATTDGYGIHYTTTTAPLNPGSSLIFQFTSGATPAALAGNSPFYTTIPVGTSFLYAGAAFSTPSLEFIVQSVPEPGSLGLLAVGAVGLLAAGWRRVRR